MKCPQELVFKNSGVGHMHFLSNISEVLHTNNFRNKPIRHY